MKSFQSPDNINTYIHNIIRMMYDDKFRPDYIVGLIRGGLVPAVQLSHYLQVPMYTLKVSLMNEADSESNCWMSEDAYGCGDKEPKKILIVDDICDTGATFNWIIKDWQSTCLPNDERWKNVWHNNVKFASIIYNEASDFDIDYFGHIINKLEKPEWCVFPWEEWW
jgi:uncharacterized protein